MIWILANPLILLAVLFLAFGLKNVVKHRIPSAITYFVLSVSLFVLAAWLYHAIATAKHGLIEEMVKHPPAKTRD